MKKGKYEIHEHKLQLETVSPVSIGDGGTLSPLTDYVLDNRNNKIYYIDKDKFEESLIDNDKVDDFTNKIYNITNRDKTYFLKDFIKKELFETVQNLSEQPIPISKRINQNPRELHTIIKSNENLYISGSTLKGAFKWIILYQFIKNNYEGQRLFQEFLRTINSEYNSKNNFRLKTRNIDDKFKEIENAVFGNLRNKKQAMLFSKFQVSDSNLTKVSEL